MEITIYRDGQTLGPYTEESVRIYLAEGSLSLADFASAPGRTQWCSLAQVLREMTHLSNVDTPIEPVTPMYSVVFRNEEKIQQGTLWLPVPAFVFSVFFTLIALLFLFEDEIYTRKEIFNIALGSLVSCSIPLALAITSVVVQERGKTMAISAISLVVGSLALIALSLVASYVESQ
jgi:heme/copper-type cytochrome/quinol oxidase subunit 4